MTSWVSREAGGSTVATPSFSQETRGYGSGRVRRFRRGIGPDDHGVGNLEDLVGRHPDALGVPADRVGAARLVDADSAEHAARLADHVAANPADLVGEVARGDLFGAGGGRFELLRALPAFSLRIT